MVQEIINTKKEQETQEPVVPETENDENKPPKIYTIESKYRKCWPEMNIRIIYSSTSQLTHNVIVIVP